MDERTTPRPIRRRVVVGALVAAVAVGLAVPLLRTPIEPEPPAPPTELAPDIGRTSTPFVYDIDFADQFHGYALWGRCTDGRDFRCERKLLVMADGKTWTSVEFAAPELAAPPKLSGRVVATGATRVMLIDLGGRSDRVYSDDSGLTWREQPPADGTLPVLDAETILETECVAATADPASCPRRLTATAGYLAHRWHLRNPPPLDQPTPEPRQLADSGWWVSGKDGSTGRWAVAASHDHGRNWTTTALTFAPGEWVERLSIAGSEDDSYVLAIGPVAGAMEPRTLIAIFLSTDRGRTWRRTWTAGRESPRTLGGSAIVTPDGGLFIPPHDVGPGYRSIDGGRTFTAVLDGPRLNSVRRTRAGYVARVSDRPSGGYLTSVDGVDWRAVQLP